MKAVPSSDLGRASARHEALLPDPHKLAAAVFLLLFCLLPLK
jgi:hypothetical protein